MNEPAKPLRILGFEGFDGGSHRAVRESISRHSRHEWTWLTRPGRAWKWRMRLGAVELIEQGKALGVFEEGFDAVFVTSMVSASDLRGLLPGRFRGLPLVLYMHENQVAYPVGGAETEESRERDVHFAFTNLTSVLAADLVLWNSAWNQDSFLEGIREILGKSPDGRKRDGELWVERVRRKSVVCWPPVEPPPEIPESGESVRTDGGGGILHNPEMAQFRAKHLDGIVSAGNPAWVGERKEKSAGAVFGYSKKGESLTLTPETLTGENSIGDGVNKGKHGGEQKSGRGISVVWAHRWEHDKGVDELLEIAERETERLGIRWTILGEQFGRIPEEMRGFGERFEGAIDHMGFEPDRGRYWEHLRRGDWVLSTARHEFFGIGVVEAMLAGCLPWLPGRLSYPELLPEGVRGISPLNPPPEDPEVEISLVRAKIREHLEPCLASNAVGRLDGLLERAESGVIAELNPPAVVR